jgi:hypothetical protein
MSRDQHEVAMRTLMPGIATSSATENLEGKSGLLLNLFSCAEFEAAD